MIRIEPPTRFSPFSLPGSLRLLRPLLLAFVACVLATPSASAQPGIRSLANLEEDVRFQPPSFRLEGMGGLGLAVRDTYSQINLWDFGGLPLGLAAARDSTSLDLWVNGVGRTFDERSGGIAYDVDRRHDSQYAGESVVRSGDLAIGADVGSFAFRHGTPFGDQSHLTNDGSQPALVPVATGRLLHGPLHWGLRGILAKETFHQQLWSDEVKNGEVSLTPSGAQLAPPDFFSPDQVSTPIYGLGVSLGWFQKQKWQAAPYLDYRRENVSSNLETVRSTYGTTENRDIWGYGLAFIAHPNEKTQVGAEVGRELFSSKENYFFTLSGGSVDPAFTGRGERLLRSVRHDYLNLRAQSDLNSTVTVGAAYRVSFDHEQIQGLEGRPTDFNTFVTERVSADTIQAPSLVASGISETRGVDYGGGASLHFEERKGLVGAEYRHFRDALGGTFNLAWATGWEARAGGEYLLDQHWIVRAGYRHHSEDQDTDSPRNELVADRATAGVQYSGWGHWNIEAYGYHEWWRTDYPDPQELGGPGTGLGLTLRRLF